MQEERRSSKAHRERACVIILLALGSEKNGFIYEFVLINQKRVYDILTECWCLVFPDPLLKYGKLRACIQGEGRKKYKRVFLELQ